jgi:hypothetical protein
VGAQDRLDRTPVEVARKRRDPGGDPGRLGPKLILVDVLVAPTAFHVDGGDDGAAGDEPDDEQPPLELGHQAGRRAAGSDVSTAASLPAAAYTPPR